MGTINSVVDIIRVHGVERAEHPCLVLGDRRLSWADLYRRSGQVANLLAAAGVGDQDRVAFLDKNGIEHFEVFYSWEGDEIRRHLNDLERLLAGWREEYQIIEGQRQQILPIVIAYSHKRPKKRCESQRHSG